MIATFKYLPAVLALCLMALAGRQAQAGFVVNDQTYLFSGNCEDCALAANTPTYAVTGSLVFQNYSFGSAFDLSNIVSFTYDGSNLQNALTWTAADLSPAPLGVYGFFSSNRINGLISRVTQTKLPDAITGIILAFEVAGNQFYIGEVGGPDGPPFLKDDGTVNSFGTFLTTDPNNVPEPHSLPLVLAALVALGVNRKTARPLR